MGVPAPAPDREATERAWSRFVELETRLGTETCVTTTLLPERTWLGPADTPHVPDHLQAEGFEVQEQIGQGGMAAVFRAVQTSLGREVALKRAIREDRAGVHQFLAEAQITGRLEHANIIPVHALLTTQDAQPLLAMKLVRGTSWHELLHGPRRGEVDLREHLRILLAVCNGVAYAHERGFLHRDLKPANVMVGDHGQVYVMDWGLAVGLDEAACREAGIPHVLAAAQPAGTPAYVAPELALGQADRQGPATDVYLLGACLHEVLTGRRRHQGASVAAVLWAASRSAPVAYDPGVPPELASIANRATARDPAERFSSVPALAAALSAYLEHREAHALVDRGLAQLGRLEAAISSAAGSTGEEAARQLQELIRLHDDVVFTLDAALALQSDEPRARDARRRASEALLGFALGSEDLALALRLLPGCDPAVWSPRVEDLRHRRQAREQELSDLRDEARRLDWSSLNAPLSISFGVVGLLGAATSLVSHLALDLERPGIPLWGNAMWLGVALLAWGFVRWLLRGTVMPDSLQSGRVQGTWTCVIAGCCFVLVANEVRGQRPFHDSHYAAMMVAMGYGAMALQSRRWLFVPAAIWVAGAALMLAFYPQRVIIFGLSWLLGMAAMTLAIRLGARF